MTKKTPATITAITALLALGAAALAGPVAAADKPDLEKCYGVAKAGKNDCAAGAHACQGQSPLSGDGHDFIAVPKGTCDRLNGGSLTQKMT
jgi:uncharacterized membrane protein